MKSIFRFFNRVFIEVSNNHLWGLLSLLLTSLVVVIVFFSYLEMRLPKVETLRHIHLQVPLEIYTSDGKLIAEFGTKRRIPVKLQKIPKQLVNAFIATEDARYYENPGVDFVGLIRAAMAVISSGRKVQGASTITMQVARNFFLSSKKTYWRKINEILLALEIDRNFSKDDILQLYLNEVYLGERAYGVAAAAQIYFGKTLDQLTLPEMASIAGLPQAPSANNPITNPKAALDRRNHVLQRMYELKYIDQNTYENAIKTPLNSSYHGLSTQVNAPYVAEMVRQAMVAKYGKKAYELGLKVTTTISSTLQPYANTALTNGILAYTKRHPASARGSVPGVQGAMIAMDPNTGAILALNGGFSFQLSHFNRAMQAMRQPGSNFKPFIFSSALAKGDTLATLINDAPIAIKSDSGENQMWRPHNDDLKFNGLLRLKVGLARSRNTISIRLLESLGIPYVLHYVSRFGFDPNTLPNTPSLALGSGVVTPLQIIRGYSVFANGGYLVTPYFIEKITSLHGKILFQANLPPPPRTISPQNAYLMTQALRSVIQNKTGTGAAASTLNRTDLAGKTGTSNKQVDGWFTGFNSNLVATVWMGFDNESISLREYGAQASLPIWIDFMQHALQGAPEATMPEPPGIVTVRINPVTGQLATPGEADAIFEVFDKRHLPGQALSAGNIDQTQTLAASNADSSTDLFQ